MDYDTKAIISIDMQYCYPASFQGYGEAKPYFVRFGHIVSVNGNLPKDIGTGFAEGQEWKFVEQIHPVILTWF